MLTFNVFPSGYLAAITAGPIKLNFIPTPFIYAVYRDCFNVHFQHAPNHNAAMPGSFWVYERMRLVLLFYS